MGRERSVFFKLLMISSTSTPKLYVSAFTVSSPLMAYSGAVYPLVFHKDNS